MYLVSFGPRYLRYDAETSTISSGSMRLPQGLALTHGNERCDRYNPND